MNINALLTVIALLRLVAVPEVLLFFHRAESTVDSNVSTSSVGHGQESTSSTLFNTLALNRTIVSKLGADLA